MTADGPTAALRHKDHEDHKDHDEDNKLVFFVRFVFFVIFVPERVPSAYLSSAS